MSLAVLLGSFAAAFASSSADDAFAQAWHAGDIEQLITALSQGANPNLVLDQDNGYPVVVYAIALSLVGHDSYAVTKALLDAGADLSLQVTIGEETFSMVEFAEQCASSCKDNLQAAQEALQNLEVKEENEEARSYLFALIALWEQQVARADAIVALLK